MNDKIAFSTAKAPRPAAAYSQGVRKGGILQVAGQVPVDPETGLVIGETVGEQTRQAMENVQAVLAEAGSGFDDVIMVRVHLTRREDFAEMNAVYEKYVREPFPARTTVFVGLAEGLLVEIDALAVVG
ncbi:Rid family detoxifying hydrolase [Actinomadura sp. DC4]|uniref:RidA family protein n=1 Tax=Actinomadura sp. DC4 TaxID=3055069 RepID=UPI0025AF040F|nr:Rid family detoxifying hydrolase [Actinomadura sp. DC4]MDN3355343.1 Rid family detoxifying hydrolase [Actinomadura sp. DC4]